MGGWLLLPETWIIDKYYDAKDDHRKFPDINAPEYQYTLIAHKKMRGVQIGREILRDYPYPDFPTLWPHVHPCFIICNSGSKLSGNWTWLEGSDPRGEMVVAMANIVAIWNSWMKAAPTAEFLENAPKDGNRDVEVNDSQRTTPHRVPLRRSTNKHRAAREQYSPMPKSSKHQTLQDGGVWLDGETLHEFDQQTSSHNDLTIPKNKWI
ncbi:hypothetical protein EDB87DRAFT_1590636 [Lactarius vividus]|nr:hypothetical protein EDB87DRAFT_1590636 [Lactarius vividus]